MKREMCFGLGENGGDDFESNENKEENTIIIVASMVIQIFADYSNYTNYINLFQERGQENEA